MSALRREAQSTPVDDLSWVLARALPLAEAWCLDALAADDAVTFSQRCRVACALYDFGICSGLLACRNVGLPVAPTTLWRKRANP